MSYERLRVVDASFLHIENDREPQHVGALLVMDGAPLRGPGGRLRLDELRAEVEGRLHRLPRLRQKVRFVPFGLGPPVWVDDESFDVARHVRSTAVPLPGDERQLWELFGDLQALPLDRDHPLWELWFVDGLQRDQVGLVVKSHHALGDGMATVDLLVTLADLDPTPAPEPPGPAYRPRPAPSPARLLADALVDLALRPVDVAEAVVGAVRRPRRAARTAAGVVAAVADLMVPTRPAPWNVPVGRHRRWVGAEVALDDLEAIRRATGATVNDVVLALCASALGDHLAHRGEVVSGRTLKAMVPVSRRAAGEHGATLGNRVSMLVVDLPVGEADPLARLRWIQRQTAEVKASDRAEGVEALLGLAGGLSVLAAPAAHLVTHAVPMNVVVTDIPGPAGPVFIHGARVRRAHPYVEVIDREGLTIAVASYAGGLYFGLTADRDVMPDLDVIGTGLEAAVAPLCAAVRGADGS